MKNAFKLESCQATIQQFPPVEEHEAGSQSELAVVPVQRIISRWIPQGPRTHRVEEVPDAKGQPKRIIVEVFQDTVACTVPSSIHA